LLLNLTLFLDSRIVISEEFSNPKLTYVQNSSKSLRDTLTVNVEFLLIAISTSSKETLNSSLFVENLESTALPSTNTSTLSTNSLRSKFHAGITGLTVESPAP
jgi:hypothetical protein